MQYKKKTRVALMLIVIIILNMFMPFTVLKTYVEAAPSSEAPVPAIVMHRITDIETHATNGRWFQVQIAAVGDMLLQAMDINIVYDNTKIELGNKNTKAKALNLNAATNQESSYTTNYATNTSYLDTTTHSFRYVLATSEPENPMDYGDSMELGYTQGYMPIYTITFRVLDESITEADLDTNLFEIAPRGTLVTGFKIGYTEGVTNFNTTSLDCFALKNFAKPAASATGIDITTNPTKIAGVSMLIALALLIGLKRNNAEIYVIVEGKVQYAGRGRINPESRYIDITKYISNYNENSIIRLMVKEKAANKIADKEIKVKVENNVITTKIVRENNKFLINVQ